MPLRVRLSITLVAIVLVPLTVTALVVLYMIDKQQERRLSDQLDYGAGALVAVLDATADRADDAAGDLVTAGAGAAFASGKPAEVKKRTEHFAAGSGADFLAVVNDKGEVVAAAVNRQPKYGLAPDAPNADTQIRALAKDLERRSSPHAVYSSVVIRVDTCPTCKIGYAVAGFWLDDTTLREVRPNNETHTDVTLVDGAGKALTTTLNDPELIRQVVSAPRDADAVTRGPLLVSGNRILDNGPYALTSASSAATQQNQQDTLRALLAILALFVVMAGMLGWLMARVTTRPLAELSDAALAVADGRLDTHIEIRSRDEVGKLALAFNTMTDELRTYIHALQDSRDELKRNLTRLGDTLSSTHDLKKMLAVILETAMVTIRAEAGALMLFSGNRDELYLKVGRGLDGRLTSSSVRVAVGEGVAGRVAQTGEGVHGQVGPDAHGELTLAASEPNADSVIAVPLKSQGRVIGVLNLYDRVDADEFDDNDLATIRSFANQATVAIDNVLLHQEAQRLSITDGLTGLWNYRYFQMNFDKEIERASRFQRPLALLLFDLDKFKQVNDVFGHQRGDSVLIELATRVKGAIREVDTLARYGGEEFVLILPETDLEGATLAAGKICEIVRQRRFGAAGEEPIRVTVSIGVAVYPEHGRGGATLVRSADAALYAAKEAGRDGYWVAAPMPEMPGEETPVPSAVDDLPVIDGTALADEDDTDLGPISTVVSDLARDEDVVVPDAGVAPEAEATEVPEVETETETPEIEAETSGAETEASEVEATEAAEPAAAEPAAAEPEAAEPEAAEPEAAGEERPAGAEHEPEGDAEATVPEDAAPDGDDAPTEAATDGEASDTATADGGEDGRDETERTEPEPAATAPLP